MNNKDLSSPATAGFPGIEALGLLTSETDIQSRLNEIASAYGKVVGVSKIACTKLDGDENDTFLVDFDRSQDALVAAQALRCYLYGFSTLLVPVPRNGGNGKAKLGASPGKR